METDSVTVAIIWTAWQMTEKVTDQIRSSVDTPENKAQKIRQIYFENYKVILHATQISPQETDVDFA